MVNYFNKIKRNIIKLLDLEHDECYEDHKDKDGICYGLVGGTKWTDDLAEQCIGCKHHTFLIRKE